jgi:hypothetical protein
MSSFFKNPPPVEGGEKKALTDKIDVITHDYEGDGLVFVIQNRDANDTFNLKFDFSESQNLKLIPGPSVTANGMACAIEAKPNEAANLCHLAIADASNGGYGMKYKVSMSKKVAGSAPLEAGPKPPGHKERKPITDKLAVLLEETDTGYVLYLESAPDARAATIEMNLSESQNLKMETAPTVEAKGPFEAVAKLAPGTMMPFVRMTMVGGGGGASLKYKVVMSAAK